jgi:hypothetical protein
MVKITKEGKEINEKNQSAYIMAGITDWAIKHHNRLFIFKPSANNNSSGVMAWPRLVHYNGMGFLGSEP